MKFTHDGTEYEVAELARFLRVKGFGRIDQPWFDAAAALLARHERVCDVLDEREALVVEQTVDHPEAHVDRGFVMASFAQIRTALRGEEAAHAQEAPHTRTGNCWDDVPVRDGYIVDVCEEHDEPRGSCLVCAKCPTCGEEAPRG